MDEGVRQSTSVDGCSPDSMAALSTKGLAAPQQLTGADAVSCGEGAPDVVGTDSAALRAKRHQE